MIERVRRFYSVITITVLLSALAAPHSAASGESFKVKDVIDGDTIRLSDGRMVRYLGVDTPEVRKRRGGGWTLDPEPYAIEARDMNRALVGARRVELEYDEKREDKYGRLLAYVYNGEKMVNEEILRKGYGVISIYPPNHKYSERMVAAQEDAKTSGRGLWKDLKVVPHGEAARHAGRVVAVRGRVAKVGSGRNAVYLNFEGGRRNDLTVEIWAGNLVFFENEGIYPGKDYKGREIEVTGKIRNDNGLRIIVFHPSQIKVL